MFRKMISRCVLPVIIAVFFVGQCEANEIRFDDEVRYEDEVITATDIAQEAGYATENYEVVTEDGYILRMDRITGSTKSPPSADKTPVLLLHGLPDASPTWVVAGPENALGLILADQGYDVWMGNARGNRYSRRNLALTTSDPDFWMFSWNEIGTYDVPAMIDHIIEHTGQEKIFMVQHSQGTTAFFVMASERPEYQEKIIAAFSLAPVAFMSRVTNTFFRLVATFVADNYSLTKSLGMYQIEPSNRLMQMIRGIMCRDGSPLQSVCTSYVELHYGRDEILNTTLLPLIAQYWPSGAALKQLAHFGQSVRAGTFRKFDYGSADNIKIYGQIHPPDYNVGNITLPVYLIYTAIDELGDVQDVQKLYEMLPNAEKFLVPRDNFAHLDFVWGKYANTLVHSKILSLMERYRK